jgi:hypothetical protein
MVIQAMTNYQPKYKWHRTQLDENDPPTDLDWIGMDGVLPIGRIGKETAGPTKGKWHWAGWYPKTHMAAHQHQTLATRPQPGLPHKR